MKKYVLMLTVFVALLLLSACKVFHSHSWMAATCTNPSTCSSCGETEGSAKGHSWKAATCTAPKTCGICHATTGTVSAHVDNGKGKCTKCGKDLFWDAVKAGLDIKLVIPSVGTTNKYFTVVYVNETGYDAYLSAFTYANGKGGYRKEADNFLLKNGMMIDVAYYEGMNLLYSSKSIYLDNNSQANTQLKINGKDVFVKFNVNGIVAIGASEREIGVY